MIKKIPAWAILAAAAAAMLAVIAFVLTIREGRIILGTITGAGAVIALVFWALDEVDL